MATRGNQTGHIRKRIDGTWEARIDTGRSPTGKRRTKSVYGKTRKEVSDKLTRLASQKLDGKLIHDDQTTVADYLDLWLSGTVKQTTRPATHLSYSQNVRIHISPALGRIKLAKLTPLHVQGFYAEMSKAGKSARMLQMNHAILRRALSRAVKMGVIPRNVCDAVDRPTIEKHEITPLDAEQVSKLMTAAEGERIYPLIVVAVFSGLREGELFGLEWGDIDLKSAKLEVRRTTVDLNGVVTTSPPKTGKGQRLVELTKLAVDALTAQKEMLIAEGLESCPLVFPNIDGTYQRRFGPFRSGFKAILKKAGLPAIRWHDLRHSAATLLLSTGCHPKIVQERLGHSTIGITMDTYSHVLPTMQREAVDKLDSLFTKKKKRI